MKGPGEATADGPRSQVVDSCQPWPLSESPGSFLHSTKAQTPKILRFSYQWGLGMESSILESPQQLVIRTTVRELQGN